MKLCYLIDLVSLKKNGGGVTNFRYIRYKFGPFDKAIYSCLEDLAANDRVSQEQGFASETANDFIVFALGKEKLDTNLLTADEIKCADEVLNEVSGYGAKALTDIAYKTKPMKALGATRGGSENLFKELDLKA